MKLAVPNTAWPRYCRTRHLPLLAELGVQGLDLVPDRLWPGGLSHVQTHQVDQLRQAVQAQGLAVLSLHGLFATRPDLSVLAPTESQVQAASYLLQASAICRDLGGRLLLLGASSRQRQGLDDKAAWLRLRAFFEHLLPRIEPHGTVICLQPMGPASGAFCHQANECRLLADALGHDSFGLQLNSTALSENGEIGHKTFASTYGRVEHFGVNEPGGMAIGASSAIDHPMMARHLSAGAYKGWVALHQSEVPGVPSDQALRQALGFFRDVYERPAHNASHVYLRERSHSICTSQNA